jgi:hypothetical protein
MTYLIYVHFIFTKTLINIDVYCLYVEYDGWGNQPIAVLICLSQANNTLPTGDLCMKCYIILLEWRINK